MCHESVNSLFLLQPSGGMMDPPDAADGRFSRADPYQRK